MMRTPRAAGVGALVALVSAMVVPLATIATTAPAAAATTLTVQVGGSNSDGSVDGQNFYPGVATIHAGDSIQWKFRGGHTVNFYTPPGDPEAPGVGNGTFTGVNDPESSGIKFPAPGSDTYTLAFPNAGNYQYFCALHPGMAGLVQVVAADSATPVTTQAQADSTGASQLAADLAAGQAAVDAFTPSSTTSNGKTTYNVANGIGDPEVDTVPVTPVATGGPSGTATLSAVNGKLHVELSMTGLAPGEHPAHIHNGQCGISSPPPGAPNDLLFPLPNLVADASGAAKVTGDFSFPQGAPPVIPANIWYVNVHTSTSDLTPVACGNVDAHPASSLRVKPASLTIKTGDTVTWTMMDAREVHPLFFGAADKASPNPFADASGGNTIASPSGAVASGPQFPGSSFSLTFTGPGTYSYFCTLHADLGMRGTVVVQGAAITNPAPVPGTLARTGSSSRTPVFLAVALLLLGSLALVGERRLRRVRA
jgi:plastocyanin